MVNKVAGRRSGFVGRADIPLVVLAVICGATLLYLGRSLTFFHDEWRSITFDGGPTDYLQPVNEHWSTLPLLLYRATFGVVELHSYLPYLAEVILLHLLAVAGAYALMKARVGSLVATLAALPLLLLGSGAENLFWAFQTGFVGSVALGVWALFFLERDGRAAPILASLLLVASLASSGIGLFLLVAAGGRTILDSELRSRAWALVPPTVAYCAWFVLVGRDAVGDTGRVVVDLSALRFAVRGIVFATEMVAGLDRLPESYLLGLLLFIGLALVVGLRTVRKDAPAPLALGCLLGLVSMYVLIAVVRAGLEVDYATASRYVYVAAFFIVLAVVDLLPRRSSWSLGATGRRTAVTIVLGLCLALSLVSNIDSLAYQRSEFQRKADMTRAFIALAAAHAEEPWVDKKVRLGVMPAVPELLETISRHGSPLEDELVPGVVSVPGVGAREAALLALVGDRFAVEPATGRGPSVPLVSIASRGLVLSERTPCVRATARTETPILTVAVAGGVRVRVQSSADIAGSIRLGLDQPPSRGIDLDLERGVAQDVVVPDYGGGRRWRIGLDFVGAGQGIALCAFRADDGRE